MIEIKKRVERYTVVDFLAICGGILGLFMGFSALSVIEIIYLSTLRLFWTIYQSRLEENKEKAKQKEDKVMEFDQTNWSQAVCFIYALTRTTTRKNCSLFSIMILIVQVQRLFRLFLKIRKFFIDYCNNSNMHGFRYFSEPKLHWSERLFWLIALVASLCVCGFLTRDVWTRWTEDPVKMDMIEKPVDAGIIPFPTVTICPEIKTTKNKLDVTAALKSPSNLSQIE